MKQFTKRHLFNLEVLEQTEKILEKNNLPPPTIYSKWRHSISPEFLVLIPPVVLCDVDALVWVKFGF